MDDKSAECIALKKENMSLRAKVAEMTHRCDTLGAVTWMYEFPPELRETTHDYYGRFVTANPHTGYAPHTFRFSRWICIANKTIFLTELVEYLTRANKYEFKINFCIYKYTQP